MFTKQKMSFSQTLEKLQRTSNQLYFKIQKESCLNLLRPNSVKSGLVKYNLFMAVQEQCIPTIQELLHKGATITPEEAEQWLSIMIREATSVSATIQVLDLILEASKCPPETLVYAACDRRSVKIMNYLISSMKNDVSKDIWTLHHQLTEWFKESSFYKRSNWEDDTVL